MTSPRKRQFAGQEQGDGLASWLNHSPKAKSRKLILEIIEGVSKLDEQFRDDFDKLIRRSPGSIDKPGLPAIMKKAVSSAPLVISQSDVDSSTSPNYVRTLRKIDRLLSGCRMRPRLLNHATGVIGQGYGTRIQTGWFYTTPAAKGAHLLIRLLEIGMLEKMRHCKNEKCRAWLFAKSTKVFCKPSCQTNYYQTSEKWKKHRRQKASENSGQSKTVRYRKEEARASLGAAGRS
jgi:hypothetical protein